MRILRKMGLGEVASRVGEVHTQPLGQGGILQLCKTLLFKPWFSSAVQCHTAHIKNFEL